MSDLYKFRANYETIHKFHLKFFELIAAGKLDQKLGILNEKFDGGEDPVNHFLSTLRDCAADQSTTIRDLLVVFLTNATNQNIDTKHDLYKFYMKNN